MARFEREQLQSSVSANVAWKKVTDALKGGFKSVEVLARVVEGEEVWEVRSWDGKRSDSSNAAGASPSQDF